jgi:hypothetical protein
VTVKRSLWLPLVATVLLPRLHGTRKVAALA